jgi:hypothetical protein
MAKRYLQLSSALTGATVLSFSDGMMGDLKFLADVPSVEALAEATQIDSEAGYSVMATDNVSAKRASKQEVIITPGDPGSGEVFLHIGTEQTPWGDLFDGPGESVFDHFRGLSVKAYDILQEWGMAYKHQIAPSTLSNTVFTDSWFESTMRFSYGAWLDSWGKDGSTNWYGRKCNGLRGNERAFLEQVLGAPLPAATIFSVEHYDHGDISIAQHAANQTSTVGALHEYDVGGKFYDPLYCVIAVPWQNEQGILEVVAKIPKTGAYAGINCMRFTFEQSGQPSYGMGYTAAGKSIDEWLLYANIFSCEDWWYDLHLARGMTPITEQINSGQTWPLGTTMTKRTSGVTAPTALLSALPTRPMGPDGQSFSAWVWGLPEHVKAASFRLTGFDSTAVDNVHVVEAVDVNLIWDGSSLATIDSLGGNSLTVEERDALQHNSIRSWVGKRQFTVSADPLSETQLWAQATSAGVNITDEILVAEDVDRNLPSVTLGQANDKAANQRGYVFHQFMNKASFSEKVNTIRVTFDGVVTNDYVVQGFNGTDEYFLGPGESWATFVRRGVTVVNYTNQDDATILSTVFGVAQSEIDSTSVMLDAHRNEFNERGYAQGKILSPEAVGPGFWCTQFARARKQLSTLCVSSIQGSRIANRYA